MPTNKHASDYINAAYLRLKAAVDAMEPPAFSLFPTSGQFEDAAKHLKDKWVSAVDDYIHALAREANSNARSNINTKDRIALLSNALHDSDLAADLESEAYALSEEREFA